MTLITSQISMLYKCTQAQNKDSFVFSCYIIISTKVIFTNHFMTAEFGQHTSTDCTLC